MCLLCALMNSLLLVVSLCLPRDVDIAAHSLEQREQCKNQHTVGQSIQVNTLTDVPDVLRAVIAVVPHDVILTPISSFPLINCTLSEQITIVPFLNK